jgi:hypothetical protein
VLDRVVLWRPRNIRVLAVYAVPGESMIDTGYWPLRNAVPAGWKNRQPVHGFRVAPGKKFTMIWALQATCTTRGTSGGQLER